MQASADERPFSIPTSLLYWFVTLLASLNFALAYVRLLSQPFFFPAYAHGRVQYPYQSRILMAIVFARTEHSRFLALICAHAHPPLNEPLKLLMVVVAFCAMVIAVYFVRLSLEFLTEDRNWAKWGSLSVIFMTYFQYILSSDSPFLYPYDLPSLAAFSVGIYLLLRRRWAWYYMLFIVGTFNRETTCFLTGFMVLFEYFPLRRSEQEPLRNLKARSAGAPRDRSLVIGMHVLLQMLLWVGIRYYSVHFFSSAAPHYVALTWTHNLREGFSPKHWPSLLSSFGFLWLVYLFGFKRIPYRALRWSGWLLLFWFAIMMCVGWNYEIRIYGELIPYMAISTVLIAHESFRMLAGKPA